MAAPPERRAGLDKRGTHLLPGVLLAMAALALAAVTAMGGEHFRLAFARGSSGQWSSGPALRGGRVLSRVPSSATSRTVETGIMSGNPLISDKKGKAGGDGDGDGPTPLQLLQVLVYRGALIIGGVCWYKIFTLDYTMTSGAPMDGSEQAWYLQVADVCAGAAACAVPVGSLLGAGLAMRAIGLAAIGSTGLTSMGAGVLGAAAGPLATLLVLAREIYWYGLSFRAFNVVSVLVFFAVALFRVTGLQSEIPVDDLPAENLANAGLYKDLPVYVEPQPVGPPVTLSFLASVSVFTTGFAKVFDPLGLDLDEEGDMFSKRSSRGLNESGFPSFKPDLSRWLPPVNQPAAQTEQGREEESRQPSS